VAQTRRGPRVDIHTTRGLGLALPVGPGERVLVVGDASLQPLAVSLENTGAEVVVHGDRLEAAVAARRAARSTGSDVPSLSAQPAEGRASFDHLLAVIADGMSPGEVVAPVVGLLRVDGYAGIGVTATPHPLLGHVPTVRRLGRELAGYGLAVERVLADESGRELPKACER
jgi:hypothetical protein